MAWPLRTCDTCGRTLVITPSGYLACTEWHGPLLLCMNMAYALRHWPAPPRARLVHLDGRESLYVLGFAAREQTAPYWVPWQEREHNDDVLRQCYRQGGAVLALDEDLRPRIFVEVDTWKRVLAAVRPVRLAPWPAMPPRD